MQISYSMQSKMHTYNMKCKYLKQKPDATTTVTAIPVGKFYSYQT